MRTLLVVAVLVCMTGVARAQVEPSVYSEFSVEARHVGLLVHLDVGVDYLHSAASQNGTRLTLSGPGASASLVIGGSVAENWFLGADLWGSSAFTPTAGIATILPQISGDQTLGLYGLGFNVTHYINAGQPLLLVQPVGDGALAGQPQPEDVSQHQPGFRRKTRHRPRVAGGPPHRSGRRRRGHGGSESGQVRWAHLDHLGLCGRLQRHLQLKAPKVR